MSHLSSSTALHHGDWLGHMAPASNMSRSEAWSTTLVQPSLFPSQAKTLWKANMRSHATAAFRGVQLLRPSRSNFSRSFFCHSATDRGCHLSSAPRTTLICRDISAGETGYAETTLPPGHPASGRLQILTCSLAPQTLCCCPS